LNEREKQALITERERQSNLVRSIEADLHQMELQEKTLASQIREKATLEETVEMMRREVVTFTAELKVILQSSLLHSGYLIHLS